jgi:hypothetical protein
VIIKWEINERLDHPDLFGWALRIPEVASDFGFPASKIRSAGRNIPGL